VTSTAPAADSHDRYMALALAEAQLGVGRTHPNPPVGALLVRDGRVVGRGHHRQAGQPHAEVEAIRAAGGAAAGADMYVTLEPHDHQGRTPPCTLAVIAAGVRRVFVGALDPNPLVSGRGVERLRTAGLEVVTGLCREAAEALIRPFATFITSGRPYVVLKAAATLDGKVATRSGDSRWVSGPASRALVHRWRDELDAVLVGAGTVRADDPELTTRLDAPAVAGRAPRHAARIVLSGRLEVDAAARLFDAAVAPTLVYTADDHGADRTSERAARVAALHARGATVVALPSSAATVDPAAMLADLGRRGYTSLLVEGGPGVHAALWRAGLVDELRLFVAPKIVGAEGLSWMGGLGLGRMNDAWRLADLRTATVGEDLLVTGRPIFGG
jgi:diaminohydroxyphosphoribosylaminopyrimidine deaminase/5-amino-6-(5-phosphoribosylamino)uracil reductase